MFVGLMQPVTAATLDTAGLALKATPKSAGKPEQASGVNGTAALSVSTQLLRLYQEAVQVAATTVPQDQLYPVHYAAGVLFADGQSLVARQDKGLEYGCTIEATSKLLAAVGAAAAAGVPPVALLHVDQFGILHAPTAKGRAHFREYGYDDMVVYVHDSDGKIVRTDIRTLVPESPAIVCTPPPSRNGQ